MRHAYTCIYGVIPNYGTSGVLARVETPLRIGLPLMSIRWQTAPAPGNRQAGEVARVNNLVSTVTRTAPLNIHNDLRARPPRPSRRASDGFAFPAQQRFMVGSCSWRRPFESRFLILHERLDFSRDFEQLPRGIPPGGPALHHSEPVDRSRRIRLACGPGPCCRDRR